MRIRLGLAAAIATVAATGALAGPAAAGDTIWDCSPDCDLVVDSTVDQPDADPGDGTCATFAGDCTLRAAIMEANTRTAAVVFVPRGHYVLTRHGIDDDASDGDLDIHLGIRVIGAGQSRTVVDGDDATRVFDVHRGAEGYISHLTVQDGRATDGPGGGIRTNAYPFHLTYLYITDNVAVPGDAEGAGNGGGIAALTEVDLNYSHVAYNHAVDGAGMWWNGIQGSAKRNAFVGNHASGDGGGMYVTGGDDQFWSLTLTANTAGGHGGGVYFDAGNGYGGFGLWGSTIASNSAPHGMGGGIWLANDGTAPERGVGGGGVIVADNGGGGNCAGLDTFESTGGNVEDEDTCGFGAATDQPDTDPLLDELADNGGPTPTRALLEGSPAIDAWPCQSFGFPDQRGVTRPQGSGCDSGAFEVGDCCPDYEQPYVPTDPPPPPKPREGDCGVLRFGTPGADLLVGTLGHDQVYGRAGDDRIFGRSQSDCLYGGAGDDFVRGGEGTDLLVGFVGDDHLSGGDGEDLVRGGRGRDRILGGDDEDRLFGGPEADFVKGGGGYDTIDAGPGDDEIDASGGGLDEVECGPGFDRVRAKRHTRLSGCERVRYVG